MNLMNFTPLRADLLGPLVFSLITLFGWGHGQWNGPCAAKDPFRSVASTPGLSGDQMG